MAFFEIVLRKLKDEKQELSLGNINILPQFKIFVKVFTVQMFAMAIKKKVPTIYYI